MLTSIAVLLSLIVPGCSPGEPVQAEARGPGAAPAQAKPARERGVNEYNVVFYISDQHRFDTMGCSGNEVVRTPNLDRFAASGMRLDHMYSPYPLCAPSRASFISGQYPRAHRVRFNGVPAAPESPRLSHHLQRLGWKAGMAGVGETEPRDARIAGFDDYRQQHLFYRWAKEQGFDGQSWFNPDGVLGTEQLGGHHYGTLDYTSDKHYSTWVANNACEMMETWKDERFFLWVGDRMPHPPYLVPEDYVGMYDPEEVPMLPSIPRDGRFDFEELKRATAHYYALITLADASFGRVLDKIDELGLTDKTIVIYTTDHGNLLGHHDQLRKATLHDDDARLPFIIRYPGQPQTGVVIEEMAEQIDVFPTICDLLGVSVPRGVQGRSMVPMLEGKEPGRDAVFGDIAYERVARQMVRTKEHKLIYDLINGHSLYDMQADPHETVNLYADPELADVRGDLMERLLDWNVRTVDVTFPDLHRNPAEARRFLEATYGIKQK